MFLPVTVFLNLLARACRQLSNSLFGETQIKRVMELPDYRALGYKFVGKQSNAMNAANVEFGFNQQHCFASQLVQSLFDYSNRNL